MKKWKLYTAIAVLVLMTGLLSFAVYASITSLGGVANRTEFITGDENVFVDISATYEGPASLTEGAETTYSFRLDQDNESAYDEERATTRVWNVGETNFIAHEQETITFTYTIENLNTVNSLKLNFTSIAVDYNQRFSSIITVYEADMNVSNSTNLTATNSSTKTASAPDIVIDPGATKIVKVEFKLLSYAEDFEFANNMKVLMSTVVEE